MEVKVHGDNGQLAPTGEASPREGTVERSSGRSCKGGRSSGGWGEGVGASRLREGLALGLVTSEVNRS